MLNIEKLTLVFIFLFLTACGGGGGGSTSSPLSPIAVTNWTSSISGQTMISLDSFTSDSSSLAYGASNDGSVVVGYTVTSGGARAFKFNETMTNLGVLNGGNYSYAYEVSGDGSIIVGLSGSSSGNRGFKYEDGTITSLGVLSGGSSSWAGGISGDGLLIVGYSDSSSGNRAFKYEDSTMTSLGVLSGGSESYAFDISYDGSVIVGWSESSNGDRAFKYENGIMTSLGVLSGGSSSVAYDVSSDGSIIVGKSESSNGDRAFKYENGIMTSLGVLNGASQSFASAISGDGSIIVGYSGDGCCHGDNARAFKYENGTMTSLGVLSGDNFSRAEGISNDGSIIVGYSGSSSGNNAFIYKSSIISVSNTYRALANTGSELYSILNYTNNIMSHNFNTDCNISYLSNFCGYLSLYNTKKRTLKNSNNQNAFKLVSAHKLTNNLYIGAAIDQSDLQLPSSYQNNGNDISLGIFVKYNGIYKDNDYDFKLSTFYSNMDYRINRDVLIDTESGYGNSNISSEGTQARITSSLLNYYGIPLMVTANLDYKKSFRDGYVEVSNIDFPVTYSPVKYSSLIGQLLFQSLVTINTNWSASGYLGLEHDLQNKTSSYNAVGQYILSVSLKPEILKDTRYRAGLNSLYNFNSNQNIKLSLHYHEVPFSNKNIVSSEIKFNYLF